MPSCSDCTYAVPAAVTRETFNKVDVGAPLCYRHGHILDRPGAGQTTTVYIQNKRAEKCGEFTKSVDQTFIGANGRLDPAKAAQVSLNVCLPDPDVDMTNASNGVKPPTCGSCRNYVEPMAVQRDLGWRVGMCAGTGRLIPSHRLVHEASNCAYGDQGAPRDDTSGLELTSWFDVMSTINMARGSRSKWTVNDHIAKHSIDPRTYESDIPVDEMAQRKGIRAWRSVADPDGLKPDRYLPIFNGAALGAGVDPRNTYVGYSPHLYEDHAGLLYDIACEVWPANSTFDNIGMKKETPLLIGQAGLGKTEFIVWCAYLMDLPVHVFTVNKRTEVGHFAGEKTLTVDPATGQSIVTFEPGDFLRVMQTPCWMLVDEPNLQQEIMEFLRPITAGQTRIIVQGANEQPFVRHPFNFMALAQNPDDDPIYVGVEPLNAADKDRLTPIEFNLPDERIEAEIIRKRCASQGYDIDAVTLNKIMQIAKELRGLIKDATLLIPWGLRTQIKVALKTQHYSLTKAYRRAGIDGLDPNTADLVMKAVETYS
jgi:dynein-related subfamily AAA family protein